MTIYERATGLMWALLHRRAYRQGIRWTAIPRIFWVGLKIMFWLSVKLIGDLTQRKSPRFILASHRLWDSYLQLTIALWPRVN